MRLCTLLLPLLAAAQPLAAPKKPVTDTYHEVKVVDEYRWLENYSDPEVRAWSDTQNRASRAFLDGLPQRPALFEELHKLYTQASTRYFALHEKAGTLFAMKLQPPKEQPMLVALRSAADPSSERVVVDPVAIDSSGHTAIDFYVPSLNGKWIAVSLSQGGSESGDVHVFDSSGKATGDVIPRVNGGTAGGSVAWNADSTGFWYTRYPRKGERPEADLDFWQQVWFHHLGDPADKDTYALGKDFPKIAEIQLSTSEDGRYTLARMANGDGGEFAHYLKGPAGEWRQITRLADSISQTAFGLDGNLYLLSRQNALKGKILRMPLDQSLSDARVFVPEGDGAIEGVLALRQYVLVSEQIGGPSRVRTFDLAGKSLGTVPLDGVATINEMVSSGTNEILFNSGTYLTPPAWFRFDPATRKVSATALRMQGAADYSDCEVLREFAVSRDGTKVPLNIVRRKGTKLDGSNPVLLTGYGGYGISLTPQYRTRLRPLLNRGFVFVEANLRGGGEYGEAWHRAGMLTRKQNVFDDFAAAARFLIDRRYTTAARLGIEGGSNGGLLMGAAFTQHPELFRAVVAHVGIYDMLRVELQPNGAFNVTEFGTVKEADQFRALYAYSPYHHVKDGTQYPAVLFMTGATDPRVDPLNSRKMVARLQASGTKLPVLLRTSSSSGHGMGTALSERIAQDADATAFLCEELGVK